ncbi:MAG: hypothetical protein ABJA71_10390 [Ginsengibacter sp.]
MNKLKLFRRVLILLVGLITTAFNVSFGQGKENIVSISKDGNIYLNPKLVTLAAVLFYIHTYS